MHTRTALLLLLTAGAGAYWWGRPAPAIAPLAPPEGAQGVEQVREDPTGMRSPVAPVRLVRIAGRVSDPQGNALAGVEIRAIGGGDTAPSIITRTNGDGRYTLAAHRAEQWTVSCKARGYTEASQTVKIFVQPQLESDDVQADFTLFPLATVQLALVVRTETKPEERTPLASFLEAHGLRALVGGQLSLDQQGSTPRVLAARTFGLPGGAPVELVAHQPAQIVWTMGVVDLATIYWEQDLQAPVKQTCQLEVEAASVLQQVAWLAFDGAQATEEAVQFHLALGDAAPVPVPATVAGDQYLIPTIAGRVTVEASLAKHATLRFAVEAHAGTTVQAGRCERLTECRLHGVVLDHNGQPFRGMLRLRPRGGVSAALHERVLPVDIDGRFAVRGLGAGEWQLEAAGSTLDVRLPASGALQAHGVQLSVRAR